MDPIQTAEIMAEQNDFYYSPYLYGFSNYSRKDYRKNILFYGDVMNLSGKGPAGTHLGGTGIAISNTSKNKDLAIEYAYWISSADCQKNIYYNHGGQPGNAKAWEDKRINEETNDFFINTRLTLEKAWVRPRHNGYMKFQDESGNILNDYLRTNIKEEFVLEKLNFIFKESFIN
jgi:multiple sugar transport system substrate-binding protein